jgi:hypothetical protein
LRGDCAEIDAMEAAADFLKRRAGDAKSSDMLPFLHKAKLGVLPQGQINHIKVYRLTLDRKFGK